MYLHYFGLNHEPSCELPLHCPECNVIKEHTNKQTKTMLYFVQMASVSSFLMHQIGSFNEDTQGKKVHRQLSSAGSLSAL